VEHFPSHVDDLRRARPVYETLPGWREDLGGVRDHAALPVAAHKYLARIGELLGRPVSIVSVGPDREQTIFRPRPSSPERPWPRSQPRTPASA
jgi:adenylosuccinate synthase